MPKRKINEATVREWYTDFKDVIYTYLVYLTLSKEVEHLVSPSVIESAKMSASKRTSRIHPHVLVLSTARVSVKRKHRRDSVQAILDSLGSDYNTSADSLQWMSAILSLPNKEREVFVLREVLGLDSRQTSQIVKYTSVKVEDRLRAACATLHDKLNNEYTKQLLRKLDSDPDSLYDSMLPLQIRNSLTIHATTDANNEGAIEARYRKWQRARTRRKLLLASTSAAVFLVVAGFAAWVYKPWVYFLKPAKPTVTTQQLRQKYIKGVGFIPRLPSTVPKGYHLVNTTIQKGNGPDPKSEQLFGAMYLTGQGQQQSTINLIEGGQQVQNFSNVHGKNKSDIMTINSVPVQILNDTQHKLITAHFQVNGTYYNIINNHGTNSSNAVSKQQIISMIRSMIVHPKVLAHAATYTYDNLNSLQEIRTNLNFTPVIVTSLPDGLTADSQQVHGFLVTHQKQQHGTVSISYVTSNQLARLNLTESKGTITGPSGQPEGGVMPQIQSQPGVKQIMIDGQKVYFYSQQNQITWKSKQTGIMFQLVLEGEAVTSSQSSKYNLQQIAKKIIEVEKKTYAP